MTIFLKLRSWALFLLCVCPNVLAIIVAPTQEDVDRWSAITVLFGLLIYFAWIWSVASFIGKTTALKTSILTKPCMLISFTLFVVMHFYLLSVEQPAENAYLNFIPIIAFTSLLYALFVTAKLLASAESGRDPKFSEWLGYAFLFLIFPLGIWALQPKVNKIFQAQAPPLSR